MTFGLESTSAQTTTVRVRGVEGVRPFIQLFGDRGHDELDTARLYGHGDTETVCFFFPFPLSESLFFRSWDKTLETNSRDPLSRYRFWVNSASRTTKCLPKSGQLSLEPTTRRTSKRHSESHWWR